MFTQSRHRNLLDWGGLILSSMFILALTFGFLR